MQSRLTTPDTWSDARPPSTMTPLRNHTDLQSSLGSRHQAPFAPRQYMQVKSFTYEKSWYGTYYRQRLFSMERMDSHIAKMLSQGWTILTQTAHSGEGRGFRPFAKRDTITISFQRP
jgi:hypothetical protein